MPHKSKPKQRTNWKQIALNIQDGFSALSQAHTGLISAYNELSLKEHGLRTCAKSFEKRINELERCLAIWRDRTAEACSKWESAEKHNALLLEEREATEGRHPAVKKLTRSEYDHFVASCNAEAKPSQKLIDLMKSPETLASLPSQLFYPGKELSEKYRAGLNPTHWQRFKSFLKHWYVELLCLMVILCVTAGCVAYVYWPRG